MSRTSPRSECHRSEPLMVWQSPTLVTDHNGVAGAHCRHDPQAPPPPHRRRRGHRHPHDGRPAAGSGSTVPATAASIKIQSGYAYYDSFKPSNKRLIVVVVKTKGQLPRRFDGLIRRRRHVRQARRRLGRLRRRPRAALLHVHGPAQGRPLLPGRRRLRHGRQGQPRPLRRDHARPRTPTARPSARPRPSACAIARSATAPVKPIALLSTATPAAAAAGANAPRRASR